MSAERVFCPACGHHVELVHGVEPRQEGQANLPDTELACMDVAIECGIAGRCPVLALPSMAVRQRLVRQGFAEHRFPRYQALCAGCDRITEMILVGETYCWCTECGTTSPTPLWDEMELPTRQQFPQ
ncbi:MAG: hypothetical protein ACYC3Q_03880 [Gemmatimonadaceae bacterium]